MTKRISYVVNAPADLVDAVVAKLHELSTTVAASTTAPVSRILLVDDVVVPEPPPAPPTADARPFDPWTHSPTN